MFLVTDFQVRRNGLNDFLRRANFVCTKFVDKITNKATNKRDRDTFQNDLRSTVRDVAIVAVAAPILGANWPERLEAPGSNELDGGNDIVLELIPGSRLVQSDPEVLP